MYHVTVNGVQYPMEWKSVPASNYAALLARELENSAFYFLPYANININTKLT